MRSHLSIDPRPSRRAYQFAVAVLSFIMVWTISLVANAQDSADLDDENEAMDLGTVVVTGTRLPNAESTSPVQVIMRDDMERLGITTVEGLIRSLPQNFANHTQTSAIDNSSSVGTIGVATANLRGLGSDGTLVLINGRRTASSPAFKGSVTNLNSIPFAAIQRVEILADGAAAIYGGDAVSGVINFIMKRGYNTPESLDVRYETGANGGDGMVVTPAFGASWDSGSIGASIRYEKFDPVLASDTGFFTRDFTSRGGSDGRAETDSFFHPRQIMFPGFRAIGGIDRNRDASVPVTFDDIDIANLTPFESIQTHMANERAATTGFVAIDQDIGESIDGFAELNYARSESVAIIGPPFASFLTVPTSNAFNETGERLRINYLFDGEGAAGLLPDSTRESETTSYAVVLGLDAQLPIKNWVLKTFVKYAEEEHYARPFDEIDEDALDLALADSNPATAFNPFGDGSQQNPDIVGNLFIVPTDGSSAPTTELDDTRQFSLVLNGDLFEIPGGAISAVLGTDIRTDRKHLDGGAATSSLLPDLSRDVLAFFSEMSIPIVSEISGVPGVHSLALRVAARWEKYEIEGPFGGANTSEKRDFSETSPSIGFAWYPVRALKVRVNVGETFKVPTLSDLFRVQRISTSSRGLGFTMPTRLGRAGVTTDPVTGDPVVGMPYVSGGNPGLIPETSDTVAAGFDWQPEGALNGLRVSATYFKIETDNVISSLTLLLIRRPDLYLTLGGAVRDPEPDGRIVQYAGFPRNFSLEDSESYDLNATYDFESNVGSWQAGLSGTYTAENNFSFVQGDPDAVVATLFGPDRTRYRIWLGWTDHEFSATLIGNYSSRYFNTSSDVQERIDGYTTIDLTAQWASEGGWQLDAGVRNLFDHDFPFVDGEQPFDPRRVDIRGRTAYIQVSKAFDLF